MPPYHLAAAQSQTQSELLRRVDALEFKLDKSKQKQTIDPVVQRPCVFSFPGLAVTGMRSGPWKNKNGDSFSTATILCDPDATGGSDTDVDVLLNGTTLLTLTLGSGDFLVEFTAVFVVGPTDLIQVETTSAGGHEGVTVELE